MSLSRCGLFAFKERRNIMSNTDNPHGFNVWGALRRARLYAVTTAPVIAFYHGDMVQAENTSAVSAKLGLGITVKEDAVIGTTDGATEHLLGVVIGVFNYQMDPILYLPIGTVGDGTVSGYLLVADDPFQEFEAQGDGEFADADIDLNYEITVPALNAGNSKTGISKMEIAATAGANVTVTIPLRLYGQAYPMEDSHAEAGCRMVCQINPLCHHYGAGVAI
jgi:hypothetical protein